MAELFLFGPKALKRFGPAAELVREQVQGRTFQNSVARFTYGPEGAVCELLAPPNALFVWLGSAAVELVDQRGALRALWEAFALAEEEGSLLVVYDEKKRYLKRPGQAPMGEARLRAPACLAMETGRERRLLFFDGREFWDLRARPGLPILTPVHE